MDESEHKQKNKQIQTQTIEQTRKAARQKKSTQLLSLASRKNVVISFMAVFVLVVISFSVYRFYWENYAKINRSTDGLSLDDALRSSPDTDGDGFKNLIDNCPFLPNPQQLDSDQDGVGDVCDNCNEYNPSQEDRNNDGIGDLCASPWETDATKWKTYKNTELGFMIKYPFEWDSKIVGKSEIAFSYNNELLIRISINKFGSGNFVGDAKRAENLNEYLDVITAYSVWEIMKDITINGERAVWVHQDAGEETMVLFENNDSLYAIKTFAFSPDYIIFTQFVGSFQFL